MKRKSCIMRKGTALLLASAMVLGLAPTLPGIGTKARAESGTAEAPTVTVYADKATLMDNTFAPGTTGNSASAIAKLKFGRNDSKKPQEWYILGRDGNLGSNNENIAIFAADNMLSSIAFLSGANSSDTSTKPKFSSSYGVTYKGNAPSNDTQMYWNHYGLSSVRKQLRAMTADENNVEYFTAKEKSFLQATTVATYDNTEVSSGNAYGYYTTSDKLYLPDSLNRNTYTTDSNNPVTNLYVGTCVDVAKESGTGGSIMLPKSKYWNTGTTSWFWLRSPYSSYYNFALTAYAGGYVYGSSHDIDGVGNSYAVRPASNLNLSSVIFASAATAATSGETTKAGSITSSGTSPAAMTLRLSGDKDALGTITINGEKSNADEDANYNSLSVKKGTKDTVSLVVQGKYAGTSSTDWYYSRQISSSDWDEDGYFSVSTDTIKTALASQGIDVIDLSKCKVWVETPVEDTYSDNTSSTLAYAVLADGEHIHVYPSVATVTELWGHDANGHWRQCVDENCPDVEGSKEAMYDKDSDMHDHSFTLEDPDALYLKDTTYRISDDKTKCIKVETYYKSCACGEPSTTDTFTKETENDHVYKTTAGWTCIEEGHLKFCLNCHEVVENGAHEYENDIAQYCTICHYDRAHKHTMSLVSAKPATCTEEGYIEHYKCNECDVISKDGMGIRKYTQAEIITPATGHKAASYKHDESKHWKVCENVNDGATCGVVFDEASHSYSGNKCTVCGYTKASDSIDSDNPTDGGSAGGGSSSNGSSNGTTYDDGSTKNTDRSSSSSSSSGGSSGGSSTYSKASTYVNGASVANASDSKTPMTAINSNDGTWEQDKNGWKYKYSTGKYAAGTTSTDSSGKLTEQMLWVKKGDAVYAFGADGYAKTGWVYNSADGKWYRCDTEKGLLKGWYQNPEDGYRYYFDTNTGEMLTGWQTIDGKQYYFAAVPAQDTYVYDSVSAKWVYNNQLNLHPYGSLYVNTTTPDGYKVDANGVKQ